MMIREMTPLDVKQVAAIERQCFSMPWSEQAFLDSISRTDTIFLLAEEEDFGEDVSSDVHRGKKIAGYIGMYVAFEEGEITNVAVAPEQRKKGIGQRLVQAMLLAGEEKSLERIVLEVRVSNSNAISLYKKNGFEELGIRKNFYERPVEDAMVMACEI